MTRKRHPRELRYSRLEQWKRMASDKKTVPGYADTLDMLDPESIRRYCRDFLAICIDPTGAQLQRIEALQAMALELDKVANARDLLPVQSLNNVEDIKVAEERLRQRRIVQLKGSE